MAKAPLEKVYLLETEQPEDSFFSPSGVIFVGEKQKITLYCLGSVHNLYRSAVVRNSWADLEKGILYRNIGFRIRDLSAECNKQGWTDIDAIPDVLRYLQDQYPRHLYFLSGMATSAQ